MRTPPFLNSGDTIGIVSTARKITEKELKSSIDFIRNWGLHIKLGKSIGAEENQYAGADQLRASDIQGMIDDPDIKAIWCAKGGYGTVRIIDRIDFSNFVKNPKWLIGYSDVTVLHSHIHNLGIQSIHGQILLGVETKTEQTASTIRKILFGADLEISYAVEKIENIPERVVPKRYSNREGTARGMLIGGNLSILYSLCGSNSTLNTDGKILFIEDLDEYLYHIDRMMMNLKRNNMLDNLAALVVGGMTEMHDNIIPFGKTAEEIIMDSVSGFSYPVVFDFPAGHVVDNRALILGCEAILSVTDKTVNLTFIN